MAAELQAQTAGRTGLTAYFVLTGPTGLVWDGAAFAAYSTSNRNSGVILATGRADGSYVADKPAGAGTDFTYALFSRAGGSAAETDELLAGPGPFDPGRAFADRLLNRSVEGAADGATTVSNYLQGYVNKVTQDSTGENITIYRADGVTVLQAVDATRLATTVGGVKNLTPE